MHTSYPVLHAFSSITGDLILLFSRIVAVIVQFKRHFCYIGGGASITRGGDFVGIGIAKVCKTTTMATSLNRATAAAAAPALATPTTTAAAEAVTLAMRLPQHTAQI